MKNIKVDITEKELGIIKGAINNSKGIIYPANDNIDLLSVLYRKKLVNIDFKNDTFFVNENGRGLVC